MDVLTDAIQNQGFYGSTEARLARARIYREQQLYGEALQELYNVLVLDPFLEVALIEQIEVALESNQPGLAVLYSQQYLLYYPSSVRGFYLEANLAAVLQLADRHCVIEKGRTVWSGTSAELAAAPEVKEAYLHV